MWEFSGCCVDPLVGDESRFVHYSGCFLTVSAIHQFRALVVLRFVHVVAPKLSPFRCFRTLQVWARRRSRSACANFRGKHMSGGEAADRPLKRLRSKTSIADIRAQHSVLLPFHQSEVLRRPSNSQAAKVVAAVTARDASAGVLATQTSGSSLAGPECSVLATAGSVKRNIKWCGIQCIVVCASVAAWQRHPYPMLPELGCEAGNPCLARDVCNS